MGRNDETQEGFAGGMLPGTGGDFLDETDVEGHGLDTGKDDSAKPGQPDGLYRGGPTTQGEVIMRGPGDNPHGDR